MRTFIIFVAALLCIGQVLAQNFVACIYDDGFPLRDVCSGGSPLPDGTPGYIYYDANSNGPDSTDSFAQLCADPPDCPNGPWGTVNFNTFLMNSGDMGLDPGEFLMDPCLTSSGIILPVARYYIVVPAGPTVWTSRVMTMVVGPQDVDLNRPSDWTCNCGDAQVPTPGSFVADNSTGCWAVHLSWTYSDTIVSVDGFRLFIDYSMIRMLDASARSFDDSLSDSRSHLYELQARRNSGGQISYSVPAWCYATRNPNVAVVSPNGAETWQVLQVDTVRWTGCVNWDAMRIELNRNFPSGPWEMLIDSTPNDGSEGLLVTGPPAIHCRIRVSVVGDTHTDVSDNDFSIRSSQGYLTLVRPSAPDNSVLAWSAGTAECGNVVNETFRFKNMGSESIVVFAPLEPASAEFSRATSCATYFALAPGQMSACSLRLLFTPSSDGNYRDTLLVQTDAINGVNGIVNIPLSGSQVTTPQTPQVVISTSGEDVLLGWSRVMHSINGCPLSIARYLVFYSPTLGGPYYYHGFASDTTYTHVGAVSFAAGTFYQVVAHMGATEDLNAIKPGAAMDNVIKSLEEADGRAQ